MSNMDSNLKTGATCLNKSRGMYKEFLQSIPAVFQEHVHFLSNEHTGLIFNYFLRKVRRIATFQRSVNTVSWISLQSESQRCISNFLLQESFLTRTQMGEFLELARLSYFTCRDWSSKVELRLIESLRQLFHLPDGLKAIDTAGILFHFFQVVIILIIIL